MKHLRNVTATEKLLKYRGVILVVLVPVALICIVMLLMPRTSFDAPVTDPFDVASEQRFSDKKRYAVIFDAGSSGSRVHVFCFNMKLGLVRIGDEVELFKQKKPGLSSYASNPKEGANSLQSLLDEALAVVPQSLQSQTPVRLGATAGLRALPEGKADELLNEVRSLLKESKFKFEPSWVSILDGVDEGAFQWVTVNYLLGFLGQEYVNTVGIVDLGGGSVQMAYSISEEDAKTAPQPDEGEDSYVKTLKLLGKTYYLYVHSYLHYGLLAARGEVLKLTKADDSGCPCITTGFKDEYKYGSEKFNAQAPTDGADFAKCTDMVVQALDVNYACKHIKCTFKGIWSGGGGDGQKKLFVASFFFDRAAEVGVIKDPTVTEAKIKASDFERMAKETCNTSYKDIGNKFPQVPKETLGYICLDLTYQYNLLVKGFGIDPMAVITLIKRIKYEGAEVEAAWPLGSAIEVVS